MPTRFLPDKTPQHDTVCHVPECTNAGTFPAPKIRHVPASIRLTMRAGYQPEHDHAQRYWFCLDHIRAYNQNWDFFKNMSSEEIDAFRKDAQTGHRSTKPISSNAEEQLYNQAMQWRNGNGNNTHTAPPLTTKERNAAQTLGITAPWDEKTLKHNYHILVKRHHPDIAGKQSEEKFKQINEAYHLLRQKEVIK